MKKQGCTLRLNSWLKNNDHAQCTRRWFLELCCTAFFFSQLKWNWGLNHLSQTGESSIPIGQIKGSVGNFPLPETPHYFPGKDSSLTSTRNFYNNFIPCTGVFTCCIFIFYHRQSQQNIQSIYTCVPLRQKLINNLEPKPQRILKKAKLLTTEIILICMTGKSVFLFCL